MESIGLTAILDDKNFQAGMKRYQDGLGQMEKSTDHTANVLTRIGSVMQGAVVAGLGAITVAIGGFVAASKIGLDTTLEWAEGLDKLGDQFGLSGEQASGFQFLANKVGLSVDEMGLGLNTLTRELNGMAADLKAGKQPTSEFAKGLQQLGVKATDSKGKIKSFDTILPQIMDAFEKLPSGINSSAVAMQLFGARGGSKFLDFLRQGSKGLTEAQKKAKLLGLQLSTEEVNAAEEFGFAVNELNLGLRGLWNQIGRQVLPIARQFVDFLNNRVIPVLARIVEKYAPAFGRVLQFAFNALDTLTTGLAGNWRPFAELMDKTFGRETANNIGNLINAFFGVRDAIVGIVQAFQTGGLSGGIQSIGDALAKAVGNVDWNKVQAQLSTWKDQFWNWLTGKGGAIDQTAAQVGKIVDALGQYVSTHSPDWLKILETWKTNFWNWLTDPAAGVLVSVADNMQKLAATIEEWSNDPATAKQFAEIGAGIANTIIDGMGRIFDKPDEGEGLLERLWRTLWNATFSLNRAFANIGSSLARGILDAIFQRFTSQETANTLAFGLSDAINKMLQILLQPGSTFLTAPQRLGEYFARGLIDSIQRIINALAPSISFPNPFGSTPTPQPAPLGTAGGAAGSAGASLGRSFASGGWVPFDMQAMLHANEYVLNRQQARAFAPMLAGNTNNTYQFNHTWNGNASAIDRGELARIAEDSAYRGIQRAMRGS